MHAADKRLVMAGLRAKAKQLRPAEQGKGEPAAVEPQTGGAAAQDEGQAGEAAAAAPPACPPTFEQRLAEGPHSAVPAAVAPWWLPPEAQPESVSLAHGATSVLLGRADVARRDRVLATTAGGRQVWALARQYAVLFRETGPGPTE